MAFTALMGCEQQNQPRPYNEDSSTQADGAVESETGADLVAEDYETINPPSPYEPTGAAPLTADEWQAVANREAFERKGAVKPKEPQKPGSFNFGNQAFFDFLSTVAWVVIVLLLAAGLAYGIYRFQRRPNLDVSRKDYSATDTLLNTAPDALAADLADKLGTRDYRMAIRLRFGQVLQELRARKLLVWAPGSTNLEYEQKLPLGLQSGFAGLAKDFAYAIYAGRRLEEAHFQRFADKAQTYLQTAFALSDPRSGNYIAAQPTSA